MGSIEIFKLFGSILVDTDEANKSISKTGKETDGLGKKFGNGIKTAGKWALGLAAAATGAATAAFAATDKITQGFDQINKTAYKVGVGAEAYQEMSYWADQNGIAQGQFEKSVGRLNQRIGMALDGNQKYAGALEKLGVNLEDVKNGTLTTDDAMTQSIQSLSKMESEHEKVALATDLFGVKLARDLLPALQDGSLSMEDAAEEARKLGKVIGQDTLDAGTAFQDNMTRMKASLSGLTQNLIANFIPVFNTMLDWIIEHMPQIQAIFQTVFDVIGVIFNTAVEWIQNLISWLGDWFSSSEDTLSSIRDAFKDYLTQVFENLKMVYENIKEAVSTAMQFIQDLIDRILDNIYKFWQKYGKQLMDSALNIFTSIKNTVETLLQAVWSIIQEVINLIVPFIQKQLKRVQEFWEENGEQIMSAVQNVMGFVEHGFNFIKGVIDFIMPIIIAILKGAWDIISAVFETAIGVIMGLVKWFTGLLTGDFESAREGLTSIWESLWNGIRGIVRGAWNLLSGAFRALWNNIRGWFTGLAGDAVQWGVNMIQGFIDGIKSMAKRAADAAKDLVSGIGDFLKFWSPAKKGEGRFITQWGENMVDGFLDGVRNETSEAGKVMNDLISSMNPGSFNVRANMVNGLSTLNSTAKKHNRQEQQNVIPEITINSRDDAESIARAVARVQRQYAFKL